jgi:hypothetical protein
VANLHGKQQQQWWFETATTTLYHGVSLTSVGVRYLNSHVQRLYAVKITACGLAGLSKATHHATMASKFMANAAFEARLLL